MKTILTLVMTGCLAISLAAAQSRSTVDQYQEALRLEEVKGDLKGAIEQYRQLAQGADRAIAAKALVRMAECLEKLGQSDARIAYERVVRDFKDQPESVLTASTRLAAAERGDGHVQLAWFDRTGRQVDTIGGLGGYKGPDLSPDGRRLAIRDQDLSNGDIWIFDLSRGTRLRFTFDADDNTRNSMPIWSPDGNRIAFGSYRNGKFGLYVKRTDGAGTAVQLLVESEYPATPMSWSPDGRFLVYTVRDDTRANLWILPLSGDQKPYRFVAEPFGESHGQISPDGRWIAYASGEPGNNGIHIRPFPDGPGDWRISTGGNFPRWRGDGKELFFMSATSFGKMMAVDIGVTGSSIQPGTPHALFDSGYDNAAGGRNIGHWHTYAVSADGQRFLIPRPVETLPPHSAGTLENSTANAGLGFTGRWLAAGSNAVIHDNYRLVGDTLSFPNLAVTGTRIETAFTYSTAGLRRQLAAPIPASETRTVYFSILLRPEGVLGAGGNNNGFFGAFLDGTGTDLFVGKPGARAIGEYVIENRGGAAQVSSGAAAVVGETVLLVVQADLRPGLDAFTLYVNPDPCKPKPVSGVVKNDIDLGDTRAVVIYSSGAFSADELRLGPRFEDVVPCTGSRR